MDTLALLATLVAAVAFAAGCLLTAMTGSVRNVKFLLGGITLVFVLLFAAGLLFSRGLLILFLFHIIAVVLILICFVIASAAAGGAIYMYRHRKPPGKSLGTAEIAEFLPAAEFATLEGISEERALARIKSSYYRGGLYEGGWYIHKSELSQSK